MKRLKRLLPASVATLLAPLAIAHEGHGVVGTVAHDLQHHVWTFAALIVIGALLLAGDRVLVALRARAARRTRRESNSPRH